MIKKPVNPTKGGFLSTVSAKLNKVTGEMKETQKDSNKKTISNPKESQHMKNSSTKIWTITIYHIYQKSFLMIMYEGLKSILLK